MLEKPIADTVGIEFEFSNLTSDDSYRLIELTESQDTFTVHGDASITNDRKKLIYFDHGRVGEFSFLSKYTNKDLTSVRSGSEIVSIPIDTTDYVHWESKVSLLLDKIRNIYYEFPGEKTSLHFHINSKGLPVWAVQNVLRLWLQTEAVIYRLGIGELGQHRGELPNGKDYLYCRPVRFPQVVHSNRDSVRYSYSVDKMLKAKNLREFFYAYGNVNIDGNPNKYHPARYSAINFFCLNSIGTIEFRVFNVILDPEIVFSLIKVCQQMIRLSLGKPLEFSDERTLGYSGDYDFGEFIDKLELDSKTGLTLQKEWFKTNWCKGVQDNLFTHSNYDVIKWGEKQIAFIPPEVKKYRRYSESGDYEQYNLREND